MKLNYKSFCINLFGWCLVFLSFYTNFGTYFHIKIAHPNWSTQHLVFLLLWNLYFLILGVGFLIRKPMSRKLMLLWVIFFNLLNYKIYILWVLSVFFLIVLNIPVVKNEFHGDKRDSNQMPEIILAMGIAFVLPQLCVKTAIF